MLASITEFTCTGIPVGLLLLIILPLERDFHSRFPAGIGEKPRGTSATAGIRPGPQYPGKDNMERDCQKRICRKLPARYPVFAVDLQENRGV